MAIFRFALTHRTRTAGTKSPRNVVEYLKREGRYSVFPEDDLRYLARTSEATQERGDLRHVETGNLPAWAEGDAAVFFEAAYQHEKRERYAIAIQMSLPRELTHEQHIALTRDFMATHLQDKAYLFVKHEPMAKDGGTQPHIHILVSTRVQDGIARGPQQYFKRFDSKRPERGGARKDPFWEQRRAPQQLRESWAILTNVHLERAGQEARVDPRELAARGIDRRPGTKWERSPEPHDFVKEQAAAVQWWEEKKIQLKRDEHGFNRDDTSTRYRGSRGTGISHFVCVAPQFLRIEGQEYEHVSNRPNSSNNIHPDSGRGIFCGAVVAHTLIETVRTYARQGGPGHYPKHDELTAQLAQQTHRSRAVDAELSIITRALQRPTRERRQDDYVRRGGLRVRLEEEYDYGRAI